MNIERIKEFVLKNIVAVIGVAFGLVSILGSVVYVYLNQCEPCEECELLMDETISLESSEEIIEPVLYKVDVKGAVKKPGVYELKESSTVNDAIIIAGGLTSNGVTTNINLSKKLRDEMVVYVFTKSELKEKETSNQIVCEIPKCECEEVKACDTIVDNSENSNTNNNSGIINNSKVSINTGTLEELMTLEGIGESKAKSIIEYRSINGLFTKLEDIKNVSGIGDSAYEKIKDRIIL